MRNGVRTEKHYPNEGGPTMKKGMQTRRERARVRGRSANDVAPGASKNMSPRETKSEAPRDTKSVARRETKDRAPLNPTVESLKKLYEDDLKDIYWAENHLLGVLPRMASAAESAELRTAFEERLAQTRNHVARLKHVFEASGLKVTAKKCEAMDGLAKEGDRVIERHARGCVRDTGLIIAGQKVAHYEMAAYGSLRTLAQVLKLDDAAGVLQETLDEEGNANRLLTGLSRTINEQALKPTAAAR